jgi:outer membrane protein assembly factor BamB
MRKRFVIVLFCILQSAICNSTDWPQWRGPRRDGITSEGPGSWPESLRSVWKTDVGIGHASPVVVGSRVYQFARQQGNEVVFALDLSSGKVVWRQEYPAPYKMNPAAVRHGEGPKSTPVAAAGRLYTFGISGILSCWDLAAGRLLWRTEFAAEYGETSPDYGTAASPLVDGGLVIVHAGGNARGALTAFDAATGRVKWRWDGDGPGYASPIVASLGGARQVVTQSRNHIVSVSAATGELLWKIPFTTAYVQNIVTPAVYGQTVILSGLDKGTFAVRPAKQGAAWLAETVWENRDVSMYMNSPVVIGDYVYGLSHKKRGQYFCLDGRSGAIQWLTDGREGDNAAIVVAGGALLLLNNGADLTVARPDPKALQALRKYTVAVSPTWAHPVVTGSGVLIKDLSNLTLWSWQ